MNSYTLKRRKLNHAEDTQIMLAKESYDDVKQRKTGSFSSTKNMATLEDKPSSSVNYINSRQEQHESFSPLAGDMYRPSKFVLQLHEMLAEVRPNYERHLAPT